MAAVNLGPGSIRDHAGRVLVTGPGQHLEQDEDGRIYVAADATPPLLTGSVWTAREGTDQPDVRVVGVQSYAEVGGGARVGVVIQSVTGEPLHDEYDEEVLNVALPLDVLRTYWERENVAEITRALDDVRAALEGM